MSEWEENAKGNWVYRTPVASGIVYRPNGEDYWKAMVKHADGKTDWGSKEFQRYEDAQSAVEPHIPKSYSRDDDRWYSSPAMKSPEFFGVDIRLTVDEMQK